MASVNLERLEPYDSKSGALNVIIETARGSRSKYKYEHQTGGFMLHKVLPCGMVFPYDFGFIPSTTGDDGDPLDVLVLMDESAFAGCRIPCRLVGVIEGEQSGDGKTERNDRLVAVAFASHTHSDVQTIKDLNEHLLDEIEHFFSAYHDLDAENFKPLGRHGPNRAEKLVHKGAKRFREEAETANGKAVRA
jgi:inorganic pyrophosphatase